MIIQDNYRGSVKNFIFSLLLLFALSAVSAQGSKIEEIDSLFRYAQGSPLRSPDSAEALGKKIQVLSREFNYQWGLVQSKLIKGLVHYQRNELDSATSLLLEVVSEAEKTKEISFEEARARNVLGLTFRRLNNFEKADDNFRIAAQIFDAINEKVYHTMSLNNIGMMHGMRGEYAEALEIFLEVRDIALGDQLPEDLAKGRLSRALGNISVVYSEMGDMDQALDFARQGLELKRADGDSIGIGRSYKIISEIFFAEDQLDSALYYNNLCLELRPPNYSRYTPIVLGSMQNIAQIYAIQGRLDEAINLLVESRNLRLENEDLGLNDAYNLIATYQRELKQYDSAIYYSKIALGEAQSNNDKPAARNAAKHLSDVFKDMNRYDSAYFYKSLYHEYNDSVFNESTVRKYNNLRVELEISEKQREIEVLEKQSEIDKKNRSLLIISIIAIIILSAGLTVFLVYRHRNRQLKLKNEVEKGQMALQQQALHMINLNNHIAEIESGLKSMKKKEVVVGKEVQGLLNNIFVNRSFEREWEQLETHFSKIHPNFNSQLLKRHDNLTQKERRLLALIKLDLNTREISGILSIEQRSVVMSRYRLKQKLGLEENEDLDAYVQTF